MKIYLNDKGYRIYVTEDEDGKWGSFIQKPKSEGGRLRRFCKRSLPLRDTEEEAERDLSIYADKNDLYQKKIRLKRSE